MRSRLEARWAGFLDEHLIEWQYEAEGFEMEGVAYLPDFWLPKLRTFLEVKGVFDDSIEKPRRLAKAVDNEKWGGVLVVLGGSRIPKDLWVAKNFPRISGPIFVKCNECSAFYFVDIEDDWTCRACGHCDGSRTFREAA